MNPASKPRSETVRPAASSRNTIVLVAGDVEVGLEYFDGRPLVRLVNRRTRAYFTVPIAFASDVVAGLNRAIDRVVANARGEVSP